MANAENTNPNLCKTYTCYNMIPEPKFCCSGSDCGCMGLPIDPPYCDECLKGFEERDKRRGALIEFAIRLKGKANPLLLAHPIDVFKEFSQREITDPEEARDLLRVLDDNDFGVYCTFVLKDENINVETMTVNFINERFKISFPNTISVTPFKKKGKNNEA